MKKFTFHLEKLLSYKAQILDSEQMTLAVLNSQLSEEQKRLLMLKMELEQCNTDYENKMLEKITPAACQMYNHYKEHLKQQILEKEKIIESISTQIEKQIELIKSLKLETKSLETLKTSRYEEYKKEDQKVAEQQLEEFVSTAKIIGNTIY